MTSLDDALNSAAPVFDGPDLFITWKELPPNQGDGNENLYEMSDVLSGEYEVSQSFDDGLPDPVTMTGSNDAAGKLSAALGGRNGTVYTGWSLTAATQGENAFSSNFIGTTIPSNTWGTTLLMAIVVPSTTAVIDQGWAEGTPYAWELIAKQASSGRTLYIFAKRSYTGIAAPSFYSDVVVSNTVYACIGVKAIDPAGNELYWRVDTMSQDDAAGSTTAHTQPAVTAEAIRSAWFSFWAGPGTGTWTLTSTGLGDTQVANTVSPTSSIVVSRAGLYTNVTTRSDITATRSAATADVAMVTIALEPWERPTMSAVQFWSPFNRDSPVSTFDRDTAQVELRFNTVTADGVQATQLFTGQMDAIPVGQQNDVSLEASSEVRITLNKSVNLPIVFGRREGGSVDWLATWIMARADRFSGPAPGPYARWWIPCYGSIKAALDAPYGFNYSMYWTPTEAAVGIRYPEFVEGPFHSAVWACHTEDLTVEIVLQATDLYRADEHWPWVTENYLPGQYLQDLFSLDNSSGRISFWVRGDATYAGTPPNVSSGNRYLFSFVHEARNSSNALLGRVWVYMEPTDRNLYVQMGNDAGGTTTLFWASSITLPTDGAWHLYSVAWDFQAGGVKIRRNGLTGSSTTWSDSENNTTGWYATDEALYAAGGKITTTFRSHLPVSDIIMEAGQEVYDTWADLWPTMPWPSFTAITRPTNQAIEAVIDDSPVNAWDTLASLSKAVGAWFRANEWDSMELLPQSYFGEPDQQVIEYVVDTEVNAQELNVVHDPSKSRNVVTVKFSETLVDENVSRVLQLTSSATIPKGTSTQVFTLEQPVAEIHGALDPYGSTWNITKLTAANVTTGPSAIPTNVHWMTLNTKPDGTGTVISLATITARIIEYTQTTVTIKFVNNTAYVLYLANNYQGDQQLPFLGILGYAARVTDGYVTERDPGSIGTRRERAMEVEFPWVQTRWHAQQLASQLVSLLARPRPEVTVEVMGDPRRVPGALVSLEDAEGTQAEGTWRVLSVTHNADGPQYTQTLQLVGTLPVAEWDEGLWDHSVWGE